MPEELTQTIPEMQERRAHLVESSGDLIDKVKRDDRGLNDDERTDLKAMRDEIERLDKKIEAASELEHEGNLVTQQRESLRVGRHREIPKIALVDDATETQARDNIEVRPRYGKLTAFTGPNAEERAHRSGMFLRAALWNDDQARRWCQQNYGEEARALGGQTAYLGGFLVPTEMLNTIIELRETYGMLRQECKVVPMSRDVMTIPRLKSGATATYTDEATALTASDANFNNVTLTAKKLGVITRLSTELAEDAIIDLADWIATDFAQAFAKKEDQTLIDGDGSTTYGGMTGLRTKIVDGNHTVGAQDATATHDSLDEITQGDLELVMGVLPDYAVDGAKFYCSQTAYVAAFQAIMSGVGGVTMSEITGKLTPTYLGVPIVRNPAMPSSLTAAAYNDEAMVLYGRMDFAVACGERRGIEVATSADRYFVEDQIAVKATERFCINVHDLGDTSTAGPLVALIGQT